MVYYGIYKETHVITVIVFWGFFFLSTIPLRPFICCCGGAHGTRHRGEDHSRL